MNLQLQKPLCVFDLETSGLDISKDAVEKGKKMADAA